MPAIAARHDRALRSTAEPSWQSPGRARRAAGIAAKTVDHPDRHRAEHALHARTHMADRDRLDLVVPQEPGHPSVMGTLGSLVMQRSPADRELLPVGDHAVDHAGDRDTIGAAPARVDLALGGDRNTHPHVDSLLVATRTLAGRLRLCPDPHRTSTTARIGTLALLAEQRTRSAARSGWRGWCFAYRLTNRVSRRSYRTAPPYL